MPLFEVADNGLHRHEATSFAELGLYERANLQRLLREQPSALGEDLLIIAEEFGQWEDSRRRIDLLALDRDAHLVVIELKRTDDGGHMELQALRYAAMVSAMTFDEVAATYQRHRALFSGGNELTDARAELADFLGLGEDPDEATISTDVRIILVSADFGREITTAVLWLNRFDGMDIRCIRLSPYHLQGTVFLDIQQVIPLPEAADYQVRLRRKDVARERSTHTDNRDFTRYHVIAGGRELPDENKRNAVRTMITELGKAGVPYENIRTLLPNRALRSLTGLLTDKDTIREALAVAYPGTDLDRWFSEHPLLDKANDKTYVVFKMWGRNTEYTLQKLSEAFPEAGVSFRAAN
ncbi:MAG TPA: hypothetical protein DGG94_13985 [Micromonosporaceae bacterium]|nr:hypothetical protein [Micromonosporaceae bacterium]HCU50887.1 hypothetical protein [Micromonosporaceae bacterium]